VADCDCETRLRRLEEASQPVQLPSGKTLRVVGDETIRGLVDPDQIGPAGKRDVELAALGAGLCPRRYLRNVGTLGLDGQARLLSARVGVAGLGGLGGFVAEILARAGVGELVLVDPDQAGEDNLNRQLLVTEENLGWDKIEAARDRLERVNSAVSLTVHRLAGDAAIFTQLFGGAKVIVDALDSLPARFDLWEAARNLGVPMVHGAIGGLSGQVTTIFPGGPGLEAIYGPRDAVRQRGVEELVGNPSATPAMIAALQAQEVIKIVAGIGEPLRGKLLILDTMTPYASIIEL